MYNKVELCGVNTAELPILSEQEKRDLLTRARAGDKKARLAKDDLELRKILAHRTDSSQVALTRAEIHVCVADKADAAPFASN